MNKSLKVFGIIIACFALTAASAAILSMIIDLGTKIIHGSMFSLLDYSLIALIISLPFTITELKNGIEVIKLTKKDAVIDSLKPVLGLVNSIIGIFSALTLRHVIALIESAIQSGGIFDLTAFAPFAFGLIILVLSNTTTNILKRNSYGKMAFFGIFFSLISFIYLCTQGLFVGGLLDLLENISNLIVVILVFVYSIIAAVYYVKNRDSIDEYDINSKDFEVVKQINSEKQKIRVYQQRKGKGNVASLVFYMLAYAFYLAFIIAYLAKTMGSNFIIDFASFEFNQALSIFDFLLVFGLLLTLPYLVFGLIGIFAKNSLYYQNGLMLGSSITVVFMTSMVDTIRIFADASVSFIQGTAEILNSNIIVFVGSFINMAPILAVFILMLIGSNHYKKLNDSMKNGDTYCSNIKHAKMFAIMYFVASILLLFGPLFNLITTGKNDTIPYLILFTMFLLMLVIASSLHGKHPLEESYITYKKIVAKTNEKELVVEAEIVKEVDTVEVVPDDKKD